MLKVVAIFRTLDGECTAGGPLQWSTFIRLGGCNLRCWKSSGFCDAPHTLDLQYPYPQMSVESILEKVQELRCRRVTITGGEPLLQRTQLSFLAKELKDNGYQASLETSGSLEICLKDTYQFHCIIMDLKPPSTEMEKKNLYKPNMSRLTAKDYVKFVLSDRLDFDWALEILKKYPTKAQIAMGPRHEYLDGRSIYHWLEEAGRFDIRLNLQLHKYLWPQPEPRYNSLKEVPYDLLVKGER